MRSPDEHEGSSPAPFHHQASAMQAEFTFLAVISDLVPGHQSYQVPVRFSGSVFLLRLTAHLMHHPNVQRNDLPELLDMSLGNKNKWKEREGCSTDVLKSYSVMSTSPQACALTPESLVSHRDLLQVYTELWPWSFVCSHFFLNHPSNLIPLVSQTLPLGFTSDSL